MIERKIYRFSCQHCRQERVSDMPVGPVCFGDGDSELATAAELIANGWRERRCQVCDRPTWIQLGARRYAWRAPADPITGPGLRPGAITPQGGRSHAASPHLKCPQIVYTDLDDLSLLAEWHEVKDDLYGSTSINSNTCIAKLWRYQASMGLTSCHSALGRFRSCWRSLKYV